MFVCLNACPINLIGRLKYLDVKRSYFIQIINTCDIEINSNLS